MSMDTDQILDCLRSSLLAIRSPRLLETERGYQGELLVQLSKRLNLPDQTILEQEYQKSALAHGLTCRPDIIIHEPFNPERHKTRADGNIAVIELKLRATKAKAADDFKSLRDMVGVLSYPLGIFVNIDSESTYSELVPEEIRSQIICFAVTLQDGKVQIIER